MSFVEDVRRCAGCRIRITSGLVACGRACPPVSYYRYPTPETEIFKRVFDIISKMIVEAESDDYGTCGVGLTGFVLRFYPTAAMISA